MTPHILYSRPGCTACAELKALLTAKGIPFVEREVEPDTAPSKPNHIELLSALAYHGHDPLDAPLPVLEDGASKWVLTYPDCMAWAENKEEQ